MSISLISLVLMTPLEQTTKLVMVALADCANESGVCWPSIDLLAIRASTSRRNVFRILATLEQSGYVSRRQRGRSGTTVFEIHVDSLDALAKKVTPRAPFTKEKGDAQSTFSTKRVTPRALKGDAHVTQNHKEPKSKDSSSLFATTDVHEDQPSPPALHTERKISKKSQPQNLSEHVWLTRWWCYAFERITGSRYAFGAKDAKLIKGLLAAPGFDETLDRACAYLLMPEAKRWPKGAPTLGGLQTMINQLVGKFDGEAEAKAIRAGLLPDDDATIGYCGYWAPWEKAA